MSTDAAVKSDDRSVANAPAAEPAKSAESPAKGASSDGKGGFVKDKEFFASQDSGEGKAKSPAMEGPKKQEEVGRTVAR